MIKDFFKKKGIKFIIGLIIMGLVVIFGIFGLILARYDTEAMDLSCKLATPSSAHLFGCDQFGRDIFARTNQGLWISVLIGFASVFIGALGGTLLGAFCGYFGGRIDAVISTVTDVLFAIPSVLIALVCVSLFGGGLINVAIALGISVIPSFAKMIRAEVKMQSSAGYVNTARMMGAGTGRILFVHILPNVMPTFLSCLFISFNNCVLAEAGLSFLGIGVTPPLSSLGYMLSDATGYLSSAPHLLIYPGAVLLLLLMGLGLISEGGSWHNAYSKRFKD